MTTTDRIHPTGRPGTAMPAFEGAPQVLKLLRKLVTRPLLGEVPVDQRGRRGIPMLCLSRGEEQAELLTALADQLKNATPRRVPHARHSFTAEADDSADQTELILVALRDLAVQLSTGANTKYGRMRFSRFHLVDWLLRQEFSEADDVDLRARLSLRSRRRDRLSRDGEPAAEAFDSRWAVLLRAVGAIRFAVRLRGRIPGVGNEYRWLLRQPYLAPQDPGTFIGFAERLTRNLNVYEDQGQLQRLIVNAFLEDVRAAHRPFPRFLRAFRRTTYTVLLLDRITPANGGNRLLRLINDVRNDIGAFDPLVVVSGSTVIPPDPAELGAADDEGQTRALETRPAVEAEDAYEHWLTLFAHYSRTRHHTAWYLPLEVPPPPDEPQRHRRQLDGIRRFAFRSPPWWARRRYTRTVAVLLAAAVAAGTGQLTIGSVQTYQACGILPWDRDAATIALRDDGECVGVSGDSHVFLDGGSPAISAIERQILTTNRDVEAAHRQEENANRPYATIVYLVAMDTGETTELNSTHEGLMGIAAAQRRLLDGGPESPLIRVHVANAGSRMQHGEWVAQQVGRLADEDDTLVGVVGLDQSREATRRTIRALSNEGLPMVAATLSAAQMPAASPLYRQVSPDNAREAEVAAAFASNVLAAADAEPAEITREIRILSPADENDLYATDLTAKVGDAFAAQGFHVEGAAVGDDAGSNRFRYLPREDSDTAPPDALRANELGRQSCDYPGLIFFAGRPDEFNSFLSGVSGRCQDDPPTILGGDDISRFAADREDRGRWPTVPFHYLSFAVGSPSCNSPSNLYTTMRELFEDVCNATIDPSLDGHAALAYDAFDVFATAITNLQRNNLRIPVRPGMVQHELSRIHGEGSLSGETGRINFGGSVDQQVPEDKVVAVLVSQGSGVPELQGLCGAHQNRDPEGWCETP
ncbi:hypothetical protein [Actinoalloteichus sp. GBA129-24]|uniref:hypothetical protein n=1 Tax=Actinoalloteichus sp. GBA129-24 TaxID=1612551 RepID=UPI000950AB5C|nr:hypothetical protein [Actinoalloteichus sp. GBA129-24]APU20072.1 hypothetical protein UA75_10285 [Actinoalloteichus sp. GBA129-24]